MITTKNGNYDNDGTITLTKDHVSTSRKFDDITVSGPKDAVAIKQMKLVDTETKNTLPLVDTNGLEHNASHHF